MTKRLTLRSLKAEVDELRKQLDPLRLKLEAEHHDQQPRRSRLSRLTARIPRLRVVWPTPWEEDR